VAINTGAISDDPLDRFRSLRRYRRRDGQRAPHKPLLVLLALGQLANSGSSELPWSEAEQRLADLITEFGPPSRTGRAQSAAYPFTRLRSDGVWVLDQDVPMDLVGPLARGRVTGHFEASLEEELRTDPELIYSIAGELARSNFPVTVASDVLEAVGLDPGTVLTASSVPPGPQSELPAERRREAAWRTDVLQSWDRQCAFCGFDGQLASASVGIDAAHVRWFAFDGPNTLDNGLALCVLHHKLFDLGALGLKQDLRIQVSAIFTARTEAGRAVYALHGRKLTPRPGTVVPSTAHVSWHAREVFKGEPLAS
jgi:putative restriction endonuclease